MAAGWLAVLARTPHREGGCITQATRTPFRAWAPYLQPRTLKGCPGVLCRLRRVCSQGPVQITAHEAQRV
jgi:hypothetical protein